MIQISKICPSVIISVPRNYGPPRRRPGMSSSSFRARSSLSSGLPCVCLLLIFSMQTTQKINTGKNEDVGALCSIATRLLPQVLARLVSHQKLDIMFQFFVPTMVLIKVDQADFLQAKSLGVFKFLLKQWAKTWHCSTAQKTCSTFTFKYQSRNFSVKAREREVFSRSLLHITIF